MDPILMRPKRLRGSRQLRSSQYFQLAADIDFGTEDWVIAMAIYVPRVVTVEKIIWVTGAMTDAQPGVRITLGTTANIYLTAGDGTVRRTLQSGNNVIVPGAWHWFVWGYTHGTSCTVYGGAHGSDMASALATTTVNTIEGSLDAGYTPAPHVGGRSTSGTVDKLAIARMAVVKGGLWDQTAREDWRDNNGRYDGLAAGTTANMIHYWMGDEHAGQLLDSVGTNHGTEAGGAIRSWMRPFSDIMSPMNILDVLAYKDTQPEWTNRTLLNTQLVSGGWWHTVVIGDKGRELYAYRVDGEAGAKANTTTLDNGYTYSVLEWLITYHEAPGNDTEELREAILYAMDTMIDVQRPNGGWPQTFNAACIDEDWPDLSASYPSSWSKSWTGTAYTNYYTLNDLASVLMIPLYLQSYAAFAQEPHLTAAVATGDFLVKAQMPSPQPGWAQQYDAAMQPAWARPWEPPAIASYETQYAIDKLLDLNAVAPKAAYLTTAAAAIDWLKASLLPDGRLARFYELTTNTPVYFTPAWEMDVFGFNLLASYTWKIDSMIAALEAKLAAQSE